MNSTFDFHFQIWLKTAFFLIVISSKEHKGNLTPRLLTRGAGLGCTKRFPIYRSGDTSYHFDVFRRTKSSAFH